MEREPRCQSIDKLFWELKDFASEATRQRLLSELRHEQPAAAAVIEEMLASEEKLGSFMSLPEEDSYESPQRGPQFADESESAALKATPASEPSGKSTETGRLDETLIPKQIGLYKLLEPIGEGGMGLVYLAQQSQPVRRKVAIKIIKPGMDSRQVIARFEAERQALAMMDHPNIAKVLDAGTTESGLPYFVMELVRGIPDDRVLRPSQDAHPSATGALSRRLQCNPARPQQRRHPPRHQAIERFGDRTRRQAAGESHRFWHRQGADR